jgi:hypothetical protein
MFIKEVLRTGLLVFFIMALSSGCKKDESGPAGPDTTPPRVISVQAITSSDVEVIFNERVDSTTAEDIMNYNIDSLSIRYATLESDEKTVILHTSTQDTSLYEIVVRFMKDKAGNAIVNQSRTFYGWYKGAWVKAGLYRSTLHWNHYEQADVFFVEEGDYVTDAFVTVDGTRLFYNWPSYRVGMIFDTGKIYNLLIESPRGCLVTGTVKMTPRVEFISPISGDTIHTGQSLHVKWEYSKGAPPESVTVVWDNWFPNYSFTFEGDRTNYTIPDSIIPDFERTTYLRVLAKNYGNLQGAKWGSYYEASDSKEIILYVKR